MAPKRLQMRLLAEKQSGVISLAQLRGIGFGIDQIRGMIAVGLLIRIHRGVYAVGHTCLTMLGRLHAARLAIGDDAFFSHRTAAAIRGLTSHRPLIELTVDAHSTPPRRDQLRIHRTTIPTDRSQATSRHGLLVATIPRTIIDLAPRERPREIDRLILQSVRTGQLNLPAMQAALDERPARPGTGLTRAALRRYLPGSEDRKSGLEASFQRHERSDPRMPTPEYNADLFGHEVDVAWFDPKVALELDGRPYHVAVADFDRDRSKDRTMIRHDWRPLRLRVGVRPGRGARRRLRRPRRLTRPRRSAQLAVAGASVSAATASSIQPPPTIDSTPIAALTLMSIP